MKTLSARIEKLMQRMQAFKSGKSSQVDSASDQESPTKENISKKDKSKLSESDSVTIVLVPDRNTNDPRIVDAVSRFAIANLAIISQEKDAQLANRTAWFVKNPIIETADPREFTCDAKNIYNKQGNKVAFTSNPDSEFYIDEQKLKETQESMGNLFGVSKTSATDRGAAGRDITDPRPSVILKSVEYDHFNNSFNKEAYDEKTYIANKIGDSVIKDGIKLGFLSIDEGYQKGTRRPISEVIKSSMSERGIDCNIVVVNIENSKKQSKGSKEIIESSEARSVRFQLDELTATENINIFKDDLEKDNGKKCYKKMISSVNQQNKDELKKLNNNDHVFDGHERQSIRRVKQNTELAESIAQARKDRMRDYARDRDINNAREAISAVIKNKYNHAREMAEQEKNAKRTADIGNAIYQHHEEPQAPATHPVQSQRAQAQLTTAQPIPSQPIPSQPTQQKGEPNPRAGLYGELSEEEKIAESIAAFKVRNLYARKPNSVSLNPEIKDEMVSKTNEYSLTPRYKSILKTSRTNYDKQPAEKPLIKPEAEHPSRAKQNMRKEIENEGSVMNFRDRLSKSSLDPEEVVADKLKRNTPKDQIHQEREVRKASKNLSYAKNTEISIF